MLGCSMKDSQKLRLQGALVLQFDAFHNVSEGLQEQSKANGDAMDAYEQGMCLGFSAGGKTQ